MPIKVESEDAAAASVPAPEAPLPASFTRDAFPLPVPTLHHDFRLVCHLDTRISIGPTPLGGQRNWIGISHGWFDASWGSGTIVPGGQDNQTVTPTLSTFVDTNYLLKTADSDPAYITVHTEGWRTGSHDVLAKLFDPAQASDVKPDEYRFRLYVRLETGDVRYQELCTAMWVASGARLGSMVVYDAYRIA